MVVVERGSPVRVPISSLVLEGSPRLAGEVAEHISLLAESEVPLPPILVHRATRRVLDGMHRVRAAMQRGEDSIVVEYFDGDEAAGFATAVQANVMHGLPLSLADREAAAAKLVAMFPQRSDRWIASIAGLAARTVAGIRARGGGANDGDSARIGRDGRVRPLNTAEARREASKVIRERPDASLREVARIVGLSPATVRDVRERMRRGIDPVPHLQRAGAEPDLVSGPGVERPVQLRARRGRDVHTLLEILKGDPALRFSETGRSLLRWLSSQAEGAAAWRKVADSVPPHCAYVVAELAAGCADEWSAFAADLEQQLGDTA